MTPIMELEIRAGEIRKRLSAIGGMADLTDEIRSEMETLRREYQDNETRQAALKIGGIESAPPIETRTSEGRDFRRLVDRANVGEIFDNVINHRAVEGATAELQKHFNLDGNQVPLALLIRNWPGQDELETRAVTPAPTNVGQNMASIIPYVFPMACATFLDVDMPTVGVGEAVYPVLTSTLAVHTPAENAAATETTGSFTAEVLSPGRIQASYHYSREDRARFAGMDAALRENLSMGLSDGLDDQILSGTNGLFTGTVLANHNVTTATTYDLYLSQLCYDRIDGRYASVSGDVKMVMGSDVYGDAGKTYRNDSVDRTVLDRLMDITGGVKVSAHVPAIASNRQNVVIKRGMAMSMVAPIWEGISIVPDEITKVAAGQVVITAIMLFANKLLRADDYYKQQIQTA